MRATGILRVIFAFAVAFFASTGAVLADEGAAAAAAGKDAAGEDAEKTPPLHPPLEERVKGLVKQEGLFTLYRPKPDDETREKETLLCLIPRALLDEDLLFATSISRGSMSGWMWTDHLVRWEIIGNNLKMVTPDTRHVRKEGAPTTDAVERTYGSSFIASVKIEAMSPGGDPLIDLTPLLKSNLADVVWAADSSGDVARGLSRWTKVKLFPDNLLIDVDLAIGDETGGSSLGVSYAFRRLPKLDSPYHPRAADDRVGYFMTSRIDWAREHAARDNVERLVQRWHLEKKDPELELSPPVEPIVFIIEKTVPIRWRRWIKEGILAWNEAFEKIGFVDAVVVRQQTDTNELADIDPEDARYNFFRWIVSGSPFAMGPSRVDPRTGQILDADIIMDDSFVRYWMADFDIFAPSAISRLKGPGFAERLRRRPDALARLGGERRPDAATSRFEQQMARVEEAMRRQGRPGCAHAFGMQQQLGLVHAAALATATGKKLPEHLIGGAIREVAAHEVGHTLGLRHNFKASSWLSLEEVRRRRDAGDEPTVGSVMDYNPLLFFEGDKIDAVRHFITPRIGPYDCWAIAYGYAVPGEGEKEEDLLAKIGAQCTKPEHAYATDEDTLGSWTPDPDTNRYDMGADPVDWAKSRVALVDALLKNVTAWAAKPGEPRYHVRAAFDTLLFQKATVYEYVARLVGGQRFHRDHQGDAGARPPFVPVPAADQRAALEFIATTLLDEKFFTFDPETLNHLAPARWSDGFWMLRLDYPIHDRIAMLQWWTLFDLLSPAVLQRVYDAELKTAAPDKLTAAELITTIRDAVWDPAFRPIGGQATDAKPFLGSIRRNLQRGHLMLMLDYLSWAPGMDVSPDLDGMIRYALRELSGRIGRTLADAQQADGSSKLDFATRAHLTECRSRIDRMLEAPFEGR